jgi:hypothetical protein
MMDTVFNLATKHLIPFQVLGNVCLFSPSAGLSFIAVCQAEGLPLLGIECYYQQGEGLALSSEDIADFSTLSRAPSEVWVRQSCHYAQGFLRSLPDPDMLVEFIVEETVAGASAT